jgi:hypothetical protein
MVRLKTTYVYPNPRSQAESGTIPPCIGTLIPRLISWSNSTGLAFPKILPWNWAKFGISENGKNLY